MVTIVIDGKKYQAGENLNLLQFMIDQGIDVPYLCHREGLTPYGACRLCMVQVVAGSKPGITTSCTMTTSEGLTIETKTPEVMQIRKVLLELYLAEAP
jgi:NADH dehydrogenase/NADH:ubiquinone oxidoreductase subunit G